MKETMRIEIEDGMAFVFTPYNADFVKKIKCMGGRKWCSDSKCWSIPESGIPTIRQYMMEIFGETNLPSGEEKVTVLVTFNETAHAWRSDVVLFGKTISHATGRDSGARVGDDVTIVSGEIRSGGSAKNWGSIVVEGSVIKLRNLPIAALEIPTEYNVTVKIQPDEIDRSALEAERERLMQRIQEINRLLADETT